MPYAYRAGLRLYYELRGPEDAPPLVLVRGLGRSSAYWLEFRSLLEERYRVLCFDNRGVGRSDVSLPGFTTEQMAEDASAVIEAAGVGKAHVFGISMGGMIAQWMAIRHPEQVDRLVLACTSPGGRLGARASMSTYVSLLRHGARGPRESTPKVAPWVLSERFLKERPEIIEIWASIAEREPRSTRGMLGQVLAAARHDAANHLSSIRARTLVCTGDADRLIPPQNSERLRERIPGAVLRHLRGAGHDFPTERPHETAALISEFISSR